MVHKNIWFKQWRYNTPSTPSTYNTVLSCRYMCIYPIIVDFIIHIFHSAVAETPYNVTVTARNSAGESDPVEIVNFTVESSCECSCYYCKLLFSGFS